jgi:HK97 family phage portal protein
MEKKTYGWVRGAIEALMARQKGSAPTKQEAVSNEVVVAMPFGLNRGKAPEYDVRLFMDEGYRRNIVAHACISVLATAASEPEMIVRTKGKNPKPLPPEHPLSRLLAAPNEHESMKEFLERILIDINAAGYAYIHKGRNRSGQVIRLFRLRPDHVFPIPGDNIAEILGYEFRPGNGARDQIIPVNDLIRINLPDPLDDHSGLSPLMVAAKFLNIHGEAARYLQDYFLNGAVPAGFIVMQSGPINPSERSRVMAEFQETFGKGSGGGERGNWHRWGVIGGDVDFKQIAPDIDKLKLDEVWGTAESNICSAFRVPAVLVQAKIGLQRNTYSSHREARTSLWEDTLPPQFNRIKSAFNRGLVIAETNEEIEIAFDMTDVAALAESEDVKIKRAADKFSSGLITRNQARAEIGETELPIDYIVVPSGAVEVDKNGKPVAPPQPPPQPGGGFPGGQPDGPQPAEEEPEEEEEEEEVETHEQADKKIKGKPEVDAKKVAKKVAVSVKKGRAAVDRTKLYRAMERKDSDAVREILSDPSVRNQFVATMGGLVETIHADGKAPESSALFDAMYKASVAAIIESEAHWGSDPERVVACVGLPYETVERLLALPRSEFKSKADAALVEFVSDVTNNEIAREILGAPVGHVFYGNQHTDGPGGGEEAAAVKEVIEKAKLAEPAITENLKSLSATVGAKMADLEFRLKSPESLGRKVVQKAAAKGISIEAAGRGINDAVRYTMVLKDDDYAKATEDVIKKLEDAGNKQIDVENFWAPGNPYKGINTVFETKEGQRFELQFHTKGSLATKSRGHVQYEIARESKYPEAARKQAHDYMVRIWNFVKTPVAAAAIGKLVSRGGGA